MSLAPLLTSWRGPAYRHIPHNSPYDVLDFRFAALAGDNRWNYPGEPTLYLAGDPGTALAEFARHLRMDRPSELASQAVKRSLYCLSVSLDRVLDLREEALVAALSLSEAPGCFLEKRIARATAQFIRVTTAAQAVFVPSMALLDQPDRWILVVFLEKLGPEPTRFLSPVVPAGTFEVSL